MLTLPGGDRRPGPKDRLDRLDRWAPWKGIPWPNLGLFEITKRSAHEILPVCPGKITASTALVEDTFGRAVHHSTSLYLTHCYLLIQYWQFTIL